jgi:ABC-type ATPase with predicted acetyltransferase domain
LSLIKEKESNKEKENINKRILTIISGKKEKIRSVSDDVREYVKNATGEFSLSQMFMDLSMVRKEEKDTARHAVNKLLKQNIIRANGKKSGIYTIVDHTENIIDWRNANDEEYKIKMPLNIHDLVKIYPGNVIIVAGASNTGKTSFMLECVRLNQKQHDTYYFNSEMGASELKTELIYFMKFCRLTNGTLLQ